MAKYQGHECIKGYTSGKFVILHNWKWDHEDNSGESVYMPSELAVNPEQVVCIENYGARGGDTHKTEIYYVSKEHDCVIENFEEVVKLLNAVSKKDTQEFIK